MNVKRSHMSTTALFIIALLVGLFMLPTSAQAMPTNPTFLADFEEGAPVGWYVFNGGATTLTTTAATVGTAESLARPGQSGDNGIMSIDFNVGDFGGFGQDFAVEGGSGPQDWSLRDGFHFWFFGANTGLIYQIDIMDNRSDPATDTSERFAYFLTDDFSGWRYVAVPWGDFVRSSGFQPGGAPDDGLTLTEMWGWAFVLPAGVSTFHIDDVGVIDRVVESFDNGMVPGSGCAGIPLGFCTFQDSASTVAIATATTPPAPLLPAFGEPNNVAQVDLNVVSFAGFINGFTNEAGDTWTPQDWSAFGALGIWIHGNGSGTSLFIDLLENRNPDSTTDDAERWTVPFDDNFFGWQYFEFPFADFTRKGVGNGAPNDGFTLDEMHGWAFGTLGTSDASLTYYLDQPTLVGTAAERPLEVTLSASNYDVEEGNSGDIVVKLTRPLKDDDPDTVSVSFSTELGSAIPGRDYTPISGTLTFTKTGVSAKSFTVETIDNNKHDGNRVALLRLSDSISIPIGFVPLASLTIVDNDPLDPTLIDDFERDPDLFYASPGLDLSRVEISAGDPISLPGQGAYEGVLHVATPILVDVVAHGSLCNRGNGVVPVNILSTDFFDATTIDHNTVMFGDAYETHRVKKSGEASRHEEDVDNDGDMDLVFHFRVNETGYDCDTESTSLSGTTWDGQAIVSGGLEYFGRDFALGRDWTRGEALNFWWYGSGSGDVVNVMLKDNRAPDPGPGGWSLVWSDEFNDPAGTPPNSANWTPEIGDGTINENPGWGNSELQYYTDSTQNSATDGNGNLVITVEEADGSLACYYGPCQYTSARLISWHKAEFAYGRIESRIQVPFGDGLWPAFWSLGNDIGEVGWPQTGEIDIMEFVGREPYEVFGTIHGPGYNGGASFGGIYTLDEEVSDNFHTFTVEWEPGLINWYIDGILYHTATPSDVAPNEWVFEHPFFLIMNVAVGGNFGGPVGDDTTFPQEMKIDYVRVYQGPDTAERFEATFIDNFTGWQQVVIPFDALTRSADQPAGAPDDGLSLNEVWGYGFILPDGGSRPGSIYMDQVRLQLIPPPTAITVMNANDSGPGSLRQALEDIAIGGTISLDPSLADTTLALTTGPLIIGKAVTIDGSAAPSLTLSGGGSDRVLIVDAGADVTVRNLTMADGYGYELAGGILNNGNLTLDHVVVRDNTMTTDAGDFWKGGAGIYNGEGATLTLVASTVSNNNAGWSGGGIYSFFSTQTNIFSSTISGNVTADVGGGLRLLGNATIVNSTFSGNVSNGWHGGAMFLTDGVSTMTNSTVAENVSPAGLADIFVGTFTDASVRLNLANSIITSGSGANCFLAYFGGGSVELISDGHNIAGDETCNLAATGDQPDTDPLLGPLADNGGPTQTHALLAGSPAIDNADGVLCPATDQRGMTRPLGAGCDIGAYELDPAAATGLAAPAEHRNGLYLPLIVR